ncbi:MAG TPA: hypothetical protein VJQ06_07310 [Rhizomicrobium sp.]|nr:hypothetical protein [Rhizomicrobium sp.]
MQKPFILVSCLLLAGCWQSTGSLLRDAKVVQPFRAGKLVSSNPDKPSEVSHARLTIGKDGSYRLAATDKADLGDAMVLRFIVLPGLPANTYVFEAVPDDACKPGQTCHPMTAQSERDYGLVRLTKTGAEVFNPDCTKSGAVAKLPGVKADDYGGCSFTNRASLEKALLDLAKQGWKTSVTYKYK